MTGLGPDRLFAGLQKVDPLMKKLLHVPFDTFRRKEAPAC